MATNRNHKAITNSIIFTDIYVNNKWGGNKGQFYSGPGSHNDYIFDYATIVADFIQKNNINRIVEIGCGDFYVTYTILKLLDAKKHKYAYIGYDVVESLISRNNHLFSTTRIKFVCKDSCIKKIANGELLLVRQVLQHLNNNSIKQIVEKFKNYRYCLVTEHNPEHSDCIIPNRDKTTDVSNRLPLMSGVYLDLEPFNYPINSVLYSFPEPFGKLAASIKTYVIENICPDK